MKPEERRNEILSILRAMQHELQVEELAEILKVSPLTVRRDLQQLALEKAIIRTHGGCLAAGRAALETEYYNKVALNFDKKQAIGKAAAKLVKPGETILINDGSTTFHLASNLSGKGPLMVYTNSLAMISELRRFEDITIYILGGEYSPELYSLSGSLTERTLEQLSFDQVFLGVDAITESGMCLVATQKEAGLTRAILRNGRKKVLLADHTKVGARSYVAYGDLKDFDTWITSPGLDRNLLSEFRKNTDVLEVVL
jgi:DeoR/GlpR family transcriptional regulator of sugar metabolism